MNHPLAVALPLMLAGAVYAANNLTPGLNQFAVDSYRELVKEQSGNLILSPFSISTALSMLMAGAHGHTASTIASVLHQNPGSGYDASVAALAAELVKAGNAGPNELSIANGLWVQTGFPLQPGFERTIRTEYQAPLTPLDFFTKPEEARAAINQWTAEHTKDKIRELLAAGSIHPDTRLVLTSAIYFYDKWQSPFQPQTTDTQPFHLAEAGSIDTKFMHQKGDFRYAETPSAQILEMMYGGTSMAFDILLPKTNNGLAALEQALDAGKLTASLEGLSNQSVEVSLPKFRAESSFSLNGVLSRLGMSDAFSTQADLSRIDGRRDLYVSEVVHKAFVDVSEEGTEAAAATGVGIRAMAVRRQENVSFRADHPFLFWIRDTATGAILFIGRLQRPQS